MAEGRIQMKNSYESKRLNAVLGQYQKKYLPLSAVDEQAVSQSLSSQGPLASWLTERRFLFPLLTEYDHIITELHQHLSTSQSELESLTARVEQVTTENARLYKELQDVAESQYHRQAEGGVGGGGGRDEGSGGGDGRTSSATIAALQHQLATIAKERDGFKEKWKQMSYKLEHLQRSEKEKTKGLEKCKMELATALQGVASYKDKVAELHITCMKLDEERQLCLQASQAGRQEVEQLSESFSQSRSELKVAQIKYAELLRTHNDVAWQLKRMEAERKQWERQGHTVDGNIHFLQLTITELEAKLVSGLREVAVLTGEKEELEERVTLQENRLFSLGSEVQEAVAHVKESMEMVESAMLEKEQAVVLSQQQAQEIERLKRGMATLLQEAGQRTRREVDVVRDEYNQNIDKMAEDIHKLEQECSQKQVTLEHAERDKRSAENEAKRLRAEEAIQTAQAEENMLQLHLQLHQAQQEREAACRKMESAVMAQRVAKSSLSEQKKENRELAENVRTKGRERAEESQRLREDRAQQLSQCQELQQQLRGAAQAKEINERRKAQEVAVLTEHYELREKELLSRMEASEKTHNKSITELRQLLTAQYRVGSRWREESKTLSHKFEEIITCLRSEVEHYRRKCEELQSQVNKLSHLQEQIVELKSARSSLHHYLSESEARANGAVSQVASLLSWEQQLLGERHELQQQLNQMRLQLSCRAGMSVISPGHRVPSTKFPPQPSPGSLEPHCWSEALTNLHHSIRQVRHEMTARTITTASSSRKQHTRSRGVVRATAQDTSSSTHEEATEHSSLSTADLSSSHLHHTHTDTEPT